MRPRGTISQRICEVNPGSRLYVFSDGAYEFSRPDGRTARLPDLDPATQPAYPAGPIEAG